MSRRKLLLTLAVAVLVMGGTVVLWPKAAPNRITPENAGRIVTG